MRFPCLLAFCLSIVLVSSITEANAQDSRAGISGRIVSSEDHRPIAYASIRLAGSGSGTVSNDSGAFFMWIPASAVADTLQVSHLGFRTKAVALAALRTGTAIVLEKEAVEMREVVVGDPLEIILKAVARIPDNYLTKPYTTKGFYRVTGRKGDLYTFLSETLFDIYNFDRTEKKQSQFRLVKHREFKDSAATQGLTIGTRPDELIACDLVYHIQDMKVFSKEGPKYYTYQLEGIVDFAGRKAYEISFDQKEGLKESRLKGKVYIDTKTHAFLYFDYGLSPRGLDYVHFPEDPAKRFLLKLLGVTLLVKQDDYHIRYRQIGKKWVLSDMTEDVHWDLHMSKKSTPQQIYPAIHYVVTDVDTTAVKPFADNEVMRSKELIEDEKTDEDSLFWKDYTVILPDFPEQPVIQRIKAANALMDISAGLEQRLRKLPKDPALRLDTILAAYHAHGLFNGSALVSWKGRVLVDKGYGFANRNTQTAASGVTGYRIGSLSKTFTSVIINQLVEEGKLDLHAPIRTYIPFYVNGSVTIDQLLTHRSGIPNLTENLDYLAQELSKTYTLKEVVTRFCSDTLEFPSGTQFSYSNSGFIVLALIAEEVTGKPFGTLLQERIFGPLHMDHSYLGMQHTPGEAIGYVAGRPELAYDARNLAGAGGIVTTPEDLLRYSEGLGQLLPPARLRDMLATRVDWPEYKAYYDYGWMTDKDQFDVSGNGHVITYHPGTDAGFFTMFARQDDRDATIVLLNNTGDFPRFEMTDLILNELNR